MNAVEEKILNKLTLDLRSIENNIKEEICTSKELKDSILKKTIDFLSKINNINTIE